VLHIHIRGAVSLPARRLRVHARRLQPGRLWCVAKDSFADRIYAALGFALEHGTTIESRVGVCVCAVPHVRVCVVAFCLSRAPGGDYPVRDLLYDHDGRDVQPGTCKPAAVLMHSTAEAVQSHPGVCVVAAPFL
jgi:hypothetical protein